VAGGFRRAREKSALVGKVTSTTAEETLMTGTEIRVQDAGASPDSGNTLPEAEFPVRVLAPFDAGAAPRVVGPGRRERGYWKRLAALGALAERGRQRAQELELELRHSHRALKTSQRIERGCQRRLDRMEDRLERREAELGEAHRAHKRLSLALGAVQREVELLRERLSLAPRGQERLSGNRPRSLWERFTGRARA